MKYDKDYIKKLAESLHIELDDKLLDKLVKDIDELAQIEINSVDLSDIKTEIQKRVNCSKMKPDTPVKTDVDALSGCKVANKYVVGK